MKKFASTLIPVLLGLVCAIASASATSMYSIEPPVSKAEYKMPYTITVYIRNQMVVAYDAKTQEPVRYMICSTGKGSSTPTGTFTMPQSRHNAWEAWNTVYVRYPTTIKRPYYFHSIPYTSKNSVNNKYWGALGQKASAGCVRLTPLDAQWINFNCAKGTRVRIVNSGAPGLADIHGQIKKDLNRYGHNSVLPTLKPTPTPPPPTLDSSSTNKTRIKALQQNLQKSGFYNGKLNGIFNPETVDAWNAYQKTQGWPEDGIATTEEQIFFATNDSVFAYNVDLKSGSSGLIVLKVEQRLKTLGFFSGTPDRKYDAKTVDAVKKYQLTAGINPANGRLDAVQQPGLFAPNAPTPTPAPDMQLGHSGKKVTALQQRLFSLGFYAGSITGRYQATTEAAVREYQLACGLEPTGQANAALQSRIATDDTVIGTARKLGLNSKGIVVRAFETALKNAGFFPGTPNHIYDANTVKCVKLYQKANNLPTTGTANAALIKQVLGL